MVQPLRKTVWRFLKKVKLELPYDSAIPLLSIHLKKKTTKKNPPMFIADVFTITKTWNDHSPRARHPGM